MEILIIKIRNIGDVAISTCMLNYIECIYPNAKVTFLTGKKSKDLLKFSKIIKNLILVDEEKIFRFLPSIFEIFKIWKFLKFFKKYDFILTCHRDYRYLLFSLFLKGLKKKLPNIKSTNNKNLCFEHHLLFPNRKLSKFPPTISTFENISKRFSNYFNNNFKKIVIAPGKHSYNKNSFGKNRTWPKKNYEELIEKLLKKNYQIIVTGIENDNILLKKYNDKNFINLIGKTSIENLIYIYKNVDLVITHDSGSFNIANLVETKVIGLFGPTDPNFINFEKFSKNIIWGGENLACSPCYNGKRYKTCDNNLCLKKITPNDVIKNVAKYFRND